MIDGKPRIGDEVYIHGYIDEIRNDVVIIRNEGGYFGTVPSEVFCYEEDRNGYGTMNSADTPQTDCDKCIWSVCNYNKVDWEADTPQTDLLVKTPHKSRESHEKNCETCRDKDAYDEWEGNCDECEDGSEYTPQMERSE